MLKEKFKKRIRRKVSGDTMMLYVVASLIGIVVFMMALSEYSNYVVVRHIEAVSDLAAVEAVRAYVDEEELRNERLTIKAENVPKIRDLYLKKVRECLPNRAAKILRVEIPTIVDGVIAVPDNYETMTFPYSTSTAFIDMGDQQGGEQQWYLLGGTTPGNSSAALVRDTSNINTASTKSKTSYIFMVKLTVIYRTNPLFGNLGGNLLNFVDIFTDTPVSIATVKNDRAVNCITIESQGKVTLR